jgi:hypothetical protein
MTFAFEKRSRLNDYYEEFQRGMILNCPMCNNKYEDDNKERLLKIDNWYYNVCPPCHLAYLKVRVKSGGRLSAQDLMLLGKTRNKFKPDP